MSNNADRMILVLGATGQQGGAVTRHLRQRGYPVRAVTRDPDKAAARALVGAGVAVVRGDMDDLDSLRAAMDGMWGVYSVQQFWGTGVEGEVRQGKLVVDAARRSRISHFVYSSVGGAERRTGIPHFESKFQVEEHLRASGLRHTILRPVFFMENWLGMREAIEGGILPQPLSPQTRLQMIATDDIGAFAALAFEHPDHWGNRAEELAGDELSMTQLAEVFGRVTGREVHYQQVPFDAFEQQAGHELAGMYRWFEEHGYEADLDRLRSEHGGLQRFSEWLSTHWRA